MLKLSMKEEEQEIKKMKYETTALLSLFCGIVASIGWIILGFISNLLFFLGLIITIPLSILACQLFYEN